MQAGLRFPRRMNLIAIGGLAAVLVVPYFVAAYNETLCQEERSSWLDEYREFHKANRGAPGARYLVYYCGPGQDLCAGTGDRVRGMLYMLRVAAVHRMVFLAQWDNPVNLTVLLSPNEIDWRPEGLPTEVISRIGKAHNTFPDRDFFGLSEWGNNLELWKTTTIHTATAWPASIVDHRVWNTTLWPPNGFLTLLGPLGGVPHEQEQRWTSEFTWYIDISSCWWHFAFKPSEAVEAKAKANLEAAYSLQSGSVAPAFVAWHWRTGGQHGETGIIRAENTQFFRSRLQQLISCINCARAMMLLNAVTEPLLLVTDLNPFRKWIRSGAMGRGVTTLPSIAQHVDMGNAQLDAYIDILADALVLSRAKCLLISQSGFSNTALMLRKEPLCYSHMDMCLWQQESFFENVNMHHHRRVLGTRAPESAELFIAAEILHSRLWVVHEALDRPRSISFKGATDLVTETDKASEEAVLAVGPMPGSPGPLRLIKADQPPATVNPYGSARWVSDVRRSLLVTGFGYEHDEAWSANMELFREFTDVCQGVRRLGAAAVDLCHLSMGVVDGYWEYRLKPWDMAAGVIIAQEAGATITTMDGRPFSVFERSMLASNGHLHQQMLDGTAPKTRALLERGVDLSPWFVPLGVKVEHVKSDFNVPGGYYALKFDYGQGPRPTSSCYEYSRSIPEPYTERYRPQTSLPMINVGIPRAFWQWHGNISRADFERAKSYGICENCMLLHYKIVNGRLYTEEGAGSRVPHSRQLHWLAWEEMLSVILYLYPMPDMEFLLLWDDECASGLPLIAPNICRQFPKAGFTFPSFSVWSQSLGPVQMATYHSCIWNSRYPPHTRKPMAVWRGSTTGARVTTTLENHKQVTRLKLHLLAQNHSDILDAKITMFTEELPDSVRKLYKPGKLIEPEDYNQYSAIIDVDGHSWSDRFGNSLIHYATPILKMASNRTGFFEHLYAPGTAFQQFNNNLEDLPEKARKVISDVQQLSGDSESFQMVRNMHATSQLLMDHIGLAEAFVYSLLKYWSLVTWKLDPSDLDGFEEVPMTCCALTRVPPEFAVAVTTRLMRKVPRRGSGRPLPSSSW
ncbi:hypothetical protein VOLCADRAFT_107362 [Volvox carteri f. nagariensis]|uniref:inositol-phosphate phosphatase n=1 Tax=Volvox carteri f. nagariensis TaxID=3068 RepID=D8UDI1_VOLCA|nr:uncharacterized protein VOLCADRAFT_107362 [Volvox carteri f. nagariensis]EFJ42172.1 hypothetical protein VOLCADRAFT_107362 [Volvox carteri f. nagariensis]|eukprot:XP_002956715.1 hypothetical protein VOLCADRAFT_107362 [Volvox carteri f. nagariensis]